MSKKLHVKSLGPSYSDTFADMFCKFLHACHLENMYWPDSHIFDNIFLVQKALKEN